MDIDRCTWGESPTCFVVEWIWHLCVISNQCSSLALWDHTYKCEVLPTISSSHDVTHAMFQHVCCSQIKFKQAFGALILNGTSLVINIVTWLLTCTRKCSTLNSTITRYLSSNHKVLYFGQWEVLSIWRGSNLLWILHTNISYIVNQVTSCPKNYVKTLHLLHPWSSIYWWQVFWCPWIEKKTWVFACINLSVHGYFFSTELILELKHFYLSTLGIYKNHD